MGVVADAYQAIYDAMVGALRTLDRSGLFGRGAERCFLTVNVIGEVVYAEADCLCITLPGR